MHKLDHEMTQNEKVKIKLEKSLLRSQVERDNARSQLEKLRRTKKKTGQILRRIRDLEGDETRLEKEISKLRVEIRNLR
jgi:predicted  nucleic acid-binding Zn-ribbon protein